MIQEDCLILDHKQTAPSYFLLTLKSKYISSHAVPGQFVNIRVSDEYDPLLRRPFSIHKIDEGKQEIIILYELVGKGTAILSQRKIGERLSVLGPLGNGFKPSDKKTAILVGGGMGVAPLLSLAEALKKQGKELYVLIGARSMDRIACEADLKALGIKVIIATEDGSAGNKGLVSDLLLDIRDEDNSVIFACGPKPMLKAVAEIAQQKKIDCQLSLEAYMACGIGACKGCAVDTKNGYKMACKDGPVFDSKEIVWND